MRVEGVAKSRDRQMWGFTLSEVVEREGQVLANRAVRGYLHGSLSSWARPRGTFCKDTNVDAWGAGQTYQACG